MQKFLVASGVALTSALVSVSAMAEGGPSFDVGDAQSAITSGMGAVATIGLAALIMVIAIKVWGRLRRAG